jgi:erythromycin esterase
MTVPAPPPDSFEAHLRAMGLGDALLVFPRNGPLPSPLQTPLGHRAIGVVYAPSHDTRQYVPSVPALRYDALVYIEATDPLTPLH